MSVRMDNSLHATQCFYEASGYLHVTIRCIMYLCINAGRRSNCILQTCRLVLE